MERPHAESVSLWAAEQRMVRTLSERMFTHVLELPLRFHLDRQTGADGAYASSSLT